MPPNHLPFTQLEQEWALKYNSLELEFENLAAKTFVLQTQAEQLQAQKQDLLKTILQLQNDFANEKERLLGVIEEKERLWREVEKDRLWRDIEKSLGSVIDEKERLGGGIEGEEMFNRSKGSEIERQVNLENSFIQSQRKMNTNSPMEHIKRASLPPYGSYPQTNIFHSPSSSPPTSSFLAPPSSSFLPLPPLAQTPPPHSTFPPPTSSLPFFPPLSSLPSPSSSPLPLPFSPPFLFPSLNFVPPPSSLPFLPPPHSLTPPSNSEFEELRLKIEMKERENRRIEGRIIDLVEEIEEWKKRYEEIEERLKRRE